MAPTSRSRSPVSDSSSSSDSSSEYESSSESEYESDAAKTCGICMEVVEEKVGEGKNRYGVLPNCTHCFCIDCIMTWRTGKEFDQDVAR